MKYPCDCSGICRTHRLWTWHLSPLWTAPHPLPPSSHHLTTLPASSQQAQSGIHTQTVSCASISHFVSPLLPLHRFSSPTAESFHLKQRLADSRHTCVQLEVQQASLKTEVAKLQGSLQVSRRVEGGASEQEGGGRG